MVEYGISGVYALQNDVNGKKYIGMSQCVRKRFNHHFHYLRNAKHYNEELQKDYDKFGEENFSFMLIEKTDNLLERERHWIDFHGGNGSSNLYNLQYSLEVRESISEKMRGNKNAEGAVFTQERRQKIGDKARKRLTGGKQSDETKRKRSESIKKWWAERKAKEAAK